MSTVAGISSDHRGAATVPLLASYWTFAGNVRPRAPHQWSPWDFGDRVEAVARAGFTGLGLWHADLEHILESRSLREMRRILDDHGIRDLELEFLGDWFVRDAARKRDSDVRRRLLLGAAEALGARHVKVGDFTQEPCPMAQMVDAFATLCEEAAEHGTRIAFELMPFANIDTLDAALELVQGAAAPNGGLALDLWHVVKLGIPYDALRRIPLRHLVSVELNDGLTGGGPWTLRDETIDQRRLCGDGDFDVRGFVRVLQQMGYDGPWGIEVLSQELRTWPLDRVASRAFDTTSAQFETSTPAP